MKQRRAPAPKTEPEATVHVTVHRCPFCRDDVAAAGSVVCEGCLSRHHTACWEEGGGCCSVCGGAARLERVAADDERQRAQTLVDGAKRDLTRLSFGLLGAAGIWAATNVSRGTDDVWVWVLLGAAVVVSVVAMSLERRG